MSDPLLSLSASRGGRRRSGRGWLLAVLLVGVAAVVAVVLVDRGGIGLGGDDDGAAAPAADADDLQDASSTVDDPETIAPTDAEAAAELEPVAGQPPLGVAGGLELVLPTADPVLVSYHEASFPEALPVAAAGTLVRNDNATRAYEEVGPDGPDYLVQVSRGRRQGPTSAVDVVMRAGDPVLSPVAGTVSEVRAYSLYGTHEDIRLELVPTDAPELRVVLIHIEGVDLVAGDRVEVGDQLATGARLFPFEAVVDRQVAEIRTEAGEDAAERFGHVHIEVKQPAPDTETDG